MNRVQGWTLAMVAGVLMWAIIIGGTCAMTGCSDPMLQGVAIGLGTSSAAEEASDMAAESKTALVAKILQLQQQLEAAATPEQQAALQAELDAANKKQERVELTATIADLVKAGIERDIHKEPTSPDNLAWILGSAATVLGGLAGKKTLDDRKKAIAINNVKVASKSADLSQGAVYKAINGA